MTETARRVEKSLADNGIGLRALSAEAVDRGPVHLSPDDMRALGVDIEVVDADSRAAQGCELVLVLGGDGTFLRRPSWPAPRTSRCSASTWAGLVSWPRPRPKLSTLSSNGWSPEITASRTA
ncbi:ATP-NAD kinase family protein [Mycobacterium xenopi 4042]|uniref:ATP-NAD kinase family protein n=1 Tax=Mycobacterium xenopi 4042 TaxID=1299334 RepID=X8BIC3_MYCXE|nr:ATP-NAD kinase family protein [Mycobacterium xenopi 4042]